jgi:hypothetical protein
MVYPQAPHYQDAVVDYASGSDTKLFFKPTSIAIYGLVHNIHPLDDFTLK